MARTSTDLIHKRRLLIFPGVALPVFLPAAVVIIAFIVFGAAFTSTAGDVFDEVQAFVVDGFGWFYSIIVSAFLVFIIWLALSKYGVVRLGMPDDRPEFGYLGWFAMLFSAGMGIGLLFWSVAEPISHFASPPVEVGDGNEEAVVAMRYTFFHWGLHAWAIYIVLGLSLAYFAFRHQLPLAIRSLLYPLIGARIYGGWGHVVDTFALFGTMFGVATSLGLGAMQVNSGLSFVAGVEESNLVQVLIISAITAVATVSVVLGLDAGIRRLSLFNVTTAGVLLLFVLLFGPTLFLARFFVQATGDYLQNIVALSLWTDSVRDSGWQSQWTYFYWGWWIAWSPFVGMFIARISRGRTIREFITGVLLVPAGITFAWLSILGGTALHQEMAGVSDITQAVNGDESTAVFVMLESLPLATITAVLTIIVVAAFFVTSSDSGSLVIDMLASGGDTDPPRSQRVFWALLEGLVAAILLLAGGLSALRTASIASGLPIAFIMVVVCYSLIKALRSEPLRDPQAEEEPAAPASPYGTRDLDVAPGEADLPHG